MVSIVKYLSFQCERRVFVSCRGVTGALAPWPKLYGQPQKTAKNEIGYGSGEQGDGLDLGAQRQSGANAEIVGGSLGDAGE